MTDLQQTYYRQVKNPNPVFTPREGAGTLKFCEKLMEKAVGFTSRFDFAIHVAHARSKGLRRRMPPVLRRRAIDALLQGLCFHYDPLANRVLMRCCRGCVFTMTRWPTASSAPSLRWPLSADWRRSLLPENSPSPGPPEP